MPTVIARQFGTSMTTRTAILDTARLNAAAPASSSSYPPLQQHVTPGQGIPALVASSIRALVSRRDTTDLERPTKRAPSDRGSAVSLVISEKRAELLKVKEQRLQAELELLEQQQVA